MKKDMNMNSEATPEALAALRARPGRQRLFDLLAKIEDGTASAEERLEFDDLTKSVREMNPNVLKG
jgi:hypothetical protein